MTQRIMLTGAICIATLGCSAMYAGEIHNAVFRDDYNKVQQLLQDGIIIQGTDPNKPDLFERTPLHSASLHGHIDIAQLLIQSGADVNETDVINKTPLHFAAQCGHTDIAQLLIRSGADVNKPNDIGITPLHMASLYNHKDIVQLLIQHGADLNQPDNSGSIPLHVVARYGHKDIARLFIQNGADVNDTGFLNKTSLHDASEEGYMDIAQLLIRSGAKVNTCDMLGETPLSKASIKGHIDIVWLLIQSGADVNNTDILGKIPLQQAQQSSFINQQTERTIACLVAHGASIDQIYRDDAQALKRELNGLIYGRTPNQTTAILPTQEQYIVLAGYGHHTVINHLTAHTNNNAPSPELIENVVTTAARRGHFDIVRDILNKNLLPQNGKIQVFEDLAHAAQNGTYKDAHNISRFNDTAQINPTIEQRHDMSQTVRTWLEKVNQQEAMHQQQKQQTAFTDIDIITQS